LNTHKKGSISSIMNQLSQPHFSIIIPVYNGDKYLQRCLESILAQTYENFEIVFVDDGSTDKSAEIIESFEDSRVRLIRQRNQGVSAARNAGIRESIYPFVAFLDSDDEWCPDHLETLAFLIAQYEDGGVYSTGFKLEYEDGSPPVEIFVDTKKESWMVCEDPFPAWSVAAVSIPSNSAVRKDVLKEAGGFREGETENEDMDLWVRIGVRRPLVASSKVTSVYHQIASVGKPRFRNWPQHILSCRTASAILQDKQEQRVRYPRSLRNYINSWNAHYFWIFVFANAREPLKTVLDNSGAKSFAPLYYWLANAPFIWPILRTINRIKRPFHSRLVLRLRGGSKRKKGVVTRLAASDSVSWSSYLKRKRKPRTISGSR